MPYLIHQAGNHSLFPCTSSVRTVAHNEKEQATCGGRLATKEKTSLSGCNIELNRTIKILFILRPCSGPITGVALPFDAFCVRHKREKTEARKNKIQSYDEKEMQHRTYAQTRLCRQGVSLPLRGTCKTQAPRPHHFRTRTALQHGTGRMERPLPVVLTQGTDDSGPTWVRRSATMNDTAPLPHSHNHRTLSANSTPTLT